MHARPLSCATDLRGLQPRHRFPPSRRRDAVVEERLVVPNHLGRLMSCLVVAPSTAVLRSPLSSVRMGQTGQDRVVPRAPGTLFPVLPCSTTACRVEWTSRPRHRWVHDPGASGASPRDAARPTKPQRPALPRVVVVAPCGRLGGAGVVGGGGSRPLSGRTRPARVQRWPVLRISSSCLAFVWSARAAGCGPRGGAAGRAVATPLPPPVPTRWPVTSRRRPAICDWLTVVIAKEAASWQKRRSHRRGLERRPIAARIVISADHRTGGEQQNTPVRVVLPQADVTCDRRWG